MQETISFQCNSCGKCCSRPPFANFYEAISLSDKFIWQTQHNIIISTASKPLEKRHVEHLQTLSHTIMVPEFDLSMFYFVNFRPFLLSDETSCPQLKNNLCSIYGSRPISCKILPLNITHSPISQQQNINFFKQKTNIEDWKCSFNNDGNPLLKNNDIYNKQYQNLFWQEINRTRDFTDKFIEFLDIQDPNLKNEHFTNLYKNSKENKITVSEMVTPLKVALFYGLLDIKSANDFLFNQLLLLKANEKRVDLFLKNDYMSLITTYEETLKMNKLSNVFNLNLE